MFQGMTCPDRMKAIAQSRKAHDASIREHHGDVAYEQHIAQTQVTALYFAPESAQDGLQHTEIISNENPILWQYQTSPTMIAGRNEGTLLVLRAGFPKERLKETFDDAGVIYEAIPTKRISEIPDADVSSVLGGILFRSDSYILPLTTS